MFIIISSDSNTELGTEEGLKNIHCMNEAVLLICIFPALPMAKSIRKVSTSNAWAKPTCLSLSLLLTPQSKPKSYLGFCKVLQSGLHALVFAHPSTLHHSIYSSPDKQSDLSNSKSTEITLPLKTSNGLLLQLKSLATYRGP